MSKEMHVGYHGAGFESPAYKLTEIWGDRLEQIAEMDKFALIAALAGWLAGAADYNLIQAVNDCSLACTDAFYLYVSILGSQERPLTPNDALALIAALTAQIRAGVHAG